MQIREAVAEGGRFGAPGRAGRGPDCRTVFPGTGPAEHPGRRRPLRGAGGDCGLDAARFGGTPLDPTSAGVATAHAG